MSIQYEEKLIQIVRQQDWIMEALKSVRDLKLPDWYLAAGAIRNSVWNYFHNFPSTSHQQDMDVVYFDSSNINKEREKLFESILNEKLPNLKWEVKNQARKNNSANSSCESIAYWSETPTCVGVRLENNDSFTICAPHGLDDLMNLVVKPIPQPYQDLSLYQERIAEKKWDKFWTKLRIVRP